MMLNCSFYLKKIVLYTFLYINYIFKGEREGCKFIKHLFKTLSRKFMATHFKFMRFCNARFL